MTNLLVLDTNIVLDLLVFADTQARPLKDGLEDGHLRWLTTQGMRDEFERVLGYPQIQAHLGGHRLDAAGVLAAFDRLANRVEAPGKACVTCSDPDDQKFIDLAVMHRCLLLSKDAAVLSMKKRLAALGVSVSATLAHERDGARGVSQRMPAAPVPFPGAALRE